MEIVWVDKWGIPRETCLLENYYMSGDQVSKQTEHTNHFHVEECALYTILPPFFLLPPPPCPRLTNTLQKERAETTCNRMSIECPGIQHWVHTCCPVPVLF